MTSFEFYTNRINSSHHNCTSEALSWFLRVCLRQKICITSYKFHDWQFRTQHYLQFPTKNRIITTVLNNCIANSLTVIIDNVKSNFWDLKSTRIRIEIQVHHPLYLLFLINVECLFPKANSNWSKNKKYLIQAEFVTNQSDWSRFKCFC